MDKQYKVIDDRGRLTIPRSVRFLTGITANSIVSLTFSKDENGENVERKSPHALMKTNRKDIEMSITIDIYGYIELGKVRVTPCNERVERPVKVQSKTNVPETEVIKATDTRTENHEIAHNFEKGEE